MKINITDLAAFLNVEKSVTASGYVTGGAIDSRVVKNGDIFFAISGENHDGHNFIKAAIEEGAMAAVVEKEVNLADFPVLKVTDTKKALQDIGRLARRYFNGKVVGVTGSNGKTTTKDMIAAVLSNKLKTEKTFANFNNELGLPLTILNCQDDREALVLEMGMRALGEIHFLAEIAKPHIGVITNIGVAHIELLKTQENIAKAKFELVDSLDKDGIAILNADDEWCVRKVPSHCQTLFYGFSEKAHVRCVDMNITPQGTLFKVQYKGILEEALLPTWGKHNVSNALAAIAVSLSLGMTLAEGVSGLQNYAPSPMRLEIKVGKTGFCIIDDAYNANPVSMMASLEVLKDMPNGRRVAVLGEMYELGAMENEGYMMVGKKVTDLGIDYLVTVGQKAELIAKSAARNGMAPENIIVFTENEVCGRFLSEFLKPQDTVLIKGSRGMHMETIVSRLT